MKTNKLTKRFSWKIIVSRNGEIETCQYSSSIIPVNRKHVLCSPAVKSWIG